MLYTSTRGRSSRKEWPLGAASFVLMTTTGTQQSIEALVQAQIDAYNAHDAERFASAHADDVRLYDLGGELYLYGREALRERYALMFASAPGIRAEIVKRMVVGNVVIDEERITGTESGRVAHAAVVYEVIDGLIRRVWVTRERSDGDDA